MVHSTRQQTDEVSSSQPEPTNGSTPYLKRAIGLLLTAGVGLIMSLWLLGGAGSHTPANRGEMLILVLAVCLTVGGTVAGLVSLDQYRRRCRASELQRLRADIRADYAEAMRSLCRTYQAALDKIVALAEEDSSRRAAAVVAIRSDVAEIRSIIAGSFPKASMLRPSGQGDSSLVRDLAAKVDALTAKVDAVADPAVSSGLDGSGDPVVDAELRGFLNGLGGPFGPGGPALS